MIKKRYQELAGNYLAYLNCVKNNRNEWRDKWEEQLHKIIDDLPHGSGIDGKTEFNLEESKEDKLIINSEYHFMDENGFYDGWQQFKIIITPSWNDFNIQIKGSFPKKYSDTKEYLAETFYHSLIEEIETKPISL